MGILNAQIEFPAISNNIVAVKSSVNDFISYQINDVISKLTSNQSINSTIDNNLAILFTGNQFINSTVNLDSLALICFCQNNRCGYFQDHLSSFARFFGVNSKQDANKIYIDKSSLPRLTLKPGNTAQSLFAALIAQVKEQESNYLISKVNIMFQSKAFITINAIPIERLILQVELYYPYLDSLDAASIKTLTPNDY